MVILGQKYTILYNNTTVYSEEMVENEDKQGDDDSASQPAPPTDEFDVTKYAPKYGTNGDNEEMLIFVSKKIDLKRNGGRNEIVRAYDSMISFLLL